MYFPSKKDIWFVFIFWGLIIGMIFIYIFGGEPIGWQIITYKSLLGYLFSALIVAFLLWIWFGTGYKIEGNLLEIKFGPFRSKIKIEEIGKIRKTKNPLSAPALSVDRLEISFGKYDLAMISPKNESEFIQRLLIINPDIQLDENLFNDRK